MYICSSMNEKIVLEDYNRQWVNKYLSEKELWESILSNNLLKIHHIGSSAIPSIKSKPIIDILIEVNSIDTLESTNQNLIELGYEVKGEYGIIGRRFYQKLINGKRKIHVHCYQNGHSNLFSHLIFRDKLRADIKLAKEYETLKIKLAAEFESDRNAYTIGKNEFIQNVLAL